jgi:hypothetical protein
VFNERSDLRARRLGERWEGGRHEKRKE